MKILRSTVSLCLVVGLLCTLIGCGYSPVKSSAEELAPVIELDGGNFTVPYELYRFYFLSELALSEKDPAALSEADRAALFAEIDRKAVDEIAAVYAVFKLCADHGLDVYDKAADKYVKEGVISAVEGDALYLGYGDFDTYLAEIKKTHMNDSVFRFLLRYRYAEKLLSAHMRDTGDLAADEATVLSYMKGEACIRASWIYIPYTALPNYTDAQLAKMEADAKAASNEDFLKMTHGVVPDIYTDAELDRGFYIGKHQLDAYYENLTDTAFSLEMGGTSSWIHAGDGVYLVRRLPKEESYLENSANLADFTEYYLLNSFYRLLSEESTRLASAAVYTAAHEDLSFEKVRMPE